MRYFEDFAIGETFDCGSRSVDREEIISFAKQWDPLRFHIDPDYAKANTPFGDVTGSGLHMMGIFRKLAVESVLADTASLGSPGTEKIRFPQPMQGGDHVRAVIKILNAVPSRSKPDRGIITFSFELHEDRKGLLMEWVALGIYKRRPVES